MPAIDRLPPEIWAEIFLHFLPTPSSSGFHSDPHKISQVCRRWRTLALALPVLWSSFHITCSPEHLSPPLHTIRTLLLRSGTHPLTFRLDTNGPGGHISGRHHHFPAILAALVATSKTWHCVTITLIFQVVQETLDAIDQIDTPLLRTFECFIHGRFPEMLSNRICMPRGPRLESLHWSDTQEPLRPPPGDPAWGQLTSMRIDGTLTTSDCLTLMQYSPRLSTVQFSEINALGDHIPPSHLLHTTLCHLYAWGTHSIMLLDNITLPSLDRLKLEVISGSPAGSRRELLDFLLRSAPPLEVLSIGNLHIPEPTLLRALSLTGELRILNIRDDEPLTAALIHALRPPPRGAPGAPLCPHLLKLMISDLDCPDGLLGGMMHARWGANAHTRGVACLEYVQVRVLGGSHRRDEWVIQALKEEGLRVMLFHGS